MCQNGYYKKIRDNKCHGGCGEEETLVHYWWEGKLVQPRWKIVWQFLKNLKVELPYDSAIPLLEVYAKKMQMLT